MPRSPAVSIIILNWNGFRDTLECLESVYRIDYDNYSVVVVDNGSENDSCFHIRTNYPQVELIENAANLGFAGGNNIGIRYALEQRAEYVFLLNNDTIVDSQIVKELLAAARTRNGIGIYGSVIYYYSEPERIWYSGAQWDSREYQFTHITDNILDVVETGYVCGCAMFISRSTLEIIGLMEPKFFLTFEESDWCFRALRCGVKSYCVPTAKLWHKISSSFGGSTSPVITYFMARNLLLWAERNLCPICLCHVVYHSLNRMVLLTLPSGKKHPLIIRIFRLVAIIIRQLSGRVYPCAHFQARYHGLRDYFLRRFGNCPQDVSTIF